MSESFLAATSQRANDASIVAVATTKPCGACCRELPRHAFLPKQWTKKQWRGCRPPRRCNDCLEHGANAGLFCDQAASDGVAANAASRVGGQIGETFPAVWSAACQEVQPLHLGRLCAAMFRTLDGLGASKAAKSAHRALAEECWASLSGIPAPAASGRTTTASRPGASAGGWSGGAGLLATCDGAKGRKALAAAELAAAVAEHAPSLCLGADIASVRTVVYLPCVKSDGICEGGAEVEAESEAAAAIETAHAAIRGEGVVFAHVHRLWAVRKTARTYEEAVTSGTQLLARALGQASLSDASFAIRCDGFPPRVAGLVMQQQQQQQQQQRQQQPQQQQQQPPCAGSSALVGAIASGVEGSVDLASPDVLLQIRGFDVGNVRFGGLALEVRSSDGARSDGGAGGSKSSGQIERDHGDDVASEGRPYFIRDCHGKAPRQAETAPLGDAEMLTLLERMEAAIAASALLPVAAAAEAVPGPSVGEAESHNAVRRRKQAAGDKQAKALSSAIAGVQLDASATGRPLWTVEFGAGTGALSKRLASDAASLACGPLTGQVLLDRSCGRGGTRQACPMGQDRWEERDSRVLAGRTLRLRIDIRHLYLPGLAEMRGVAMMAVGKHVCGVATDLMLRSVVEPSGAAEAARRPPDDDANDGGAAAAGSGGGEAAAEVGCHGIGVALCCHHLCTYEDYVHPAFVAQAGLSAADFGQVCRLSSLAMSCRGAKGDPFRQRVGATCKAFLDAGRCIYLRERGFDASLIAYCSPEESPENRLLLAKRVRSG